MPRSDARMRRDENGVKGPDRAGFTAAREKVVTTNAKAGDRDAFAELVRRNIGLVAHFARLYPHPNVPLEDRIQDGCIGLIEAAKRFDPSRGCRFSTYAAWWIRKEIIRSLASTGRLVRLPESATRRQKELAAAEARLWHDGGRRPTTSEIAAAVGVDAEWAEILVRAGQEPVSIDDSPAAVASISKPPGALRAGHEAEDIARRLDLAARVGGLLDSLSPREREIIVARYGLGTGVPLSLAEVGERHGLTRERIRQIQRAALDRLREQHGHDDGSVGGGALDSWRERAAEPSLAVT